MIPQLDNVNLVQILHVKLVKVIYSLAQHANKTNIYSTRIVINFYLPILTVIAKIFVSNAKISLKSLALNNAIPSYNASTVKKKNMN